MHHHSLFVIISTSRAVVPANIQHNSLLFVIVIKHNVKARGAKSRA
jgi:hypothetical protein